METQNGIAKKMKKEKREEGGKKREREGERRRIKTRL